MNALATEAACQQPIDQSEMMSSFAYVSNSRPAMNSLFLSVRAGAWKYRVPIPELVRVAAGAHHHSIHEVKERQAQGHERL